MSWFGIASVPARARVSGAMKMRLGTLSRPSSSGSNNEDIYILPDAQPRNGRQSARDSFDLQPHNRQFVSPHISLAYRLFLQDRAFFLTAHTLTIAGAQPC